MNGVVLPLLSNNRPQLFERSNGNQYSCSVLLFLTFKVKVCKFHVKFTTCPRGEIYNSYIYPTFILHIKVWKRKTFQITYLTESESHPIHISTNFHKKPEKPYKAIRKTSRATKTSLSLYAQQLLFSASKEKRKWKTVVAQFE